jgi:NADH:ubiquinone oxidoreductase subunit 3 (subunit A)
MSDGRSNSTFLKVVAILSALAGFSWYFFTGLVPKEFGVLDGGLYCLSMLFVVPEVFAIYLFPRADEKSEEQARWFGIVCGIIAIPLAAMLTYAYVAGKLHGKV